MIHTDKPLLSVCVPILNAMPYLKERMDSIFAQDFQDYEIIVCDSYSSDGSWEYIESIKDSRLRKYQVPRRGVFAGWNECIRRAQGKYLHIATADDKEDPNLYSTLIKLLEENPQIPLAYAKLVFIDETSKEIKKSLSEFEILNVLHRREGILPQVPCHFFGLVYYPTWISINTVIYHRALHDELGYWREDCYSFADCLFAEQYYRRYPSIYTKKTLGYWRQHGTQQTYAESEAKNRKWRLEKQKTIIEEKYLDLYVKEFSQEELKEFKRLLASIEAAFFRKKSYLLQRLACLWIDLKRFFKGELPPNFYQRNKELIKIISVDFAIWLIFENKKKAFEILASFHNRKRASIKLKYSSNLPRNAVIPDELLIKASSDQVTVILWSRFSLHPKLNEKDLPYAEILKQQRLIYLTEGEIEAEEKELLEKQNVELWQLNRAQRKDSLQSLFDSIKDSKIFFLAREDHLIANAIEVMSNLMNIHSDIEWLMPSLLMFSKLSASGRSTDDEYPFYLSNPVLTPGRFTVIFPRVSSVSGTMIRSEALRRICWKNLPSFEGGDLDFLLLCILGVTIKPAYFSGVSVRIDSERFWEWTYKLSTIPRRLRKELFNSLRAEDLWDNRAYHLLKLIYWLGDVNSPQYKWVKRHLLPRWLKNRHTNTVFLYDQDRGEWERHERFMLKSLH